MIAYGKISLQVVRHRIHARRCRDVSGKAERQLRIADRHGRDQIRAEDHRLASCGLQRDHGAAAHFAARAGGGGDRDHGRKRGTDFVPAVLQVVVVFEGQGMSRFQPNGLAGIDRASAPQSDHAVAVLSLIDFNAGKNARLGRIPLHPVEGRPFETTIA